MAARNISDAAANPPKRQMPAFLANLANANSNIICTASAVDVGKISVADLLQKRLSIPMFQRRYCWCKDQWATLLGDATTVALGSKEKHSLGRITCVKSEAESRLLVIDGQQRNTTCTLLLAAIRDTALECHAEDPLSESLASRVDGILFPDNDNLQQWLRIEREAKSGIVIADGTKLDFAALVPTYCDRAAYFASILHPGVGATVTSAQWQRPLEAKAYFVDKLKACSLDHLACLADAVLHKLEWLFFPISTNGKHNDGTEDLQVIFERLAVRDATWCKPQRATEFASMGAADFIRNLLLGSFRTEEDAIRMYKLKWLPIEQAAAAASIRNKSSDISEVLDSMLGAFLKAQPETDAAQSRQTQLLQIGGELYPRFRKWLGAALAAAPSIGTQPCDDDSTIQERKTELLLDRLHAFALEYLSSVGAATAQEENSNRFGLGPSKASNLSARKPHFPRLMALNEGGVCQ